MSSKYGLGALDAILGMLPSSTLPMGAPWGESVIPPIEEPTDSAPPRKVGSQQLIQRIDAPFSAADIIATGAGMGLITGIQYVHKRKLWRVLTSDNCWLQIKEQQADACQIIDVGANNPRMVCTLLNATAVRLDIDLDWVEFEKNSYIYLRGRGVLTHIIPVHLHP